MNITYDELLNNMQNAYFDKTGTKLDLNSSAGVRVQAVATELFSLAAFGNYVLKQAFVQTATGQYLDSHAAMRDIRRKEAGYAIGKLAFRLNEAQEQDVDIPSGTVCCVGDSPYLQFATTADATITAGTLAVTVSATALNTGVEFNVSSGAIDTIVNPPAFVSSVSNTFAFTGGCHQEYDTALRNRVLRSYSIPSTGFNAKCIEETILSIDGVIDCYVYTTMHGFVTIYLREVDSSSEAHNEIVKQIRQKVYVYVLCDVNLLYRQAEALPFDLTVEVFTTHGVNDQLKEQVNAVINESVESLRIAEKFSLSKLVSAICNIDGVEYCEASSPSGNSNFVSCTLSKYLTLNDLQVSYYE